MPQGVLQLHQLNKQVMLGIEFGRSHRRLEVEAEPLLDADVAQLRTTLGQVKKEYKVEHNGRGQDGIAAEEIHLNLHGIAQPAEDINIVPAFFVVATRWVVVDADLMKNIAVKLRIKLRLQNVLQNTQLRFFLGLEGSRIFQHLAVAVPQDIGGVPPAQAQHAGLERRSQNGLHQRLAGLEILAADGSMVGA